MTILDDLYEEDHFGLVIFDNEIETWRPALSKATKENINEAKKYVSHITARHSKNCFFRTVQLLLHFSLFEKIILIGLWWT